MKASEKAYRAILLIFMGLMPYISYLVYNFQYSEVTMTHGYIYSNWDLLIIAISFAIEHIYRYYIRSLKHLLYPLVDDVKYPTKNERLSRAKDISIKIGSFIHYSIMCMAFYVAFYGEDNMPTMIGGKNTCEALFKGFPNPKEALTVSYLRYFYLFQLGTNFYKLIYQSIFNWENDTYYEYTLHHFLTTFLIAYSYLINALKMGSFIMLIHDISDLGFLFSRIYFDYKWKNLKMMIPLNIISLIAWIYMRLYVLPACALRTLYFGNIWDEGFPFQNDFALPLKLEILMLTMLFFMHIFWTYLIIKGILKMYLKRMNKKVK